MPKPLQAGKDFLLLQFQNRSADHHHDIDAGQIRPLPAKALANDPFDAVAIHRPSKLFLGNGKSQTRAVAFLPWTHQHRDVSIPDAEVVGKDPAVVAGTGQPARPVEARVTGVGFTGHDRSGPKAD